MNLSRQVKAFSSNVYELFIDIAYELQEILHRSLFVALATRKFFDLTDGLYF